MGSKFKIFGIYSDGMVLQQNTKNCIYGEGEINKKVMINFRKKTYSTKINSSGKWKIEFNPEKAGGPFELSVICDDNEIVFHDVYVGEVWLLSGQSNAQLPMQRLKYSFPHDVTLPENNNIRMITVPINYSFDGEKSFVENPTWVSANPQDILSMSGTGYFFAKQLSKLLDTPVGIINASQGGSPITAWMSEQSLIDLNKNNYLEILNKWRQKDSIQNQIEKETLASNDWMKKIDDSDEGLKNNWEKLSYNEVDNWDSCFIPNNFSDIPEGGICWFKKEVDISPSELIRFKMEEINLWLGVIVDADKVWVNGTFIGETTYCYPPRRYVIPKNVLKAGKNTITVRVMKNNQTPIRFYEDKFYWLFNSKVNINLAGEWKKRVTSSVSCRPGNTFFEWQPTALYNSMLAPCFNYAIKGAVWYQGESNTLSSWEYSQLLQKMIFDWRKKFIYSSEKMPFIVVQLPNWGDGYNDEEKNYPQDWAWMRMAQKEVVQNTENTGLVVTIDSGEWNDLHPEDKQTVGNRIATEAMRLAYSVKNSDKKLYQQPPCFKEFVIQNDKIIISFSDNKLKTDTNDKIVTGFYFVCGPNYETKQSTPIFASEGSSYFKAEGVLIDDCTVEVTIPPEVRNNDAEKKELRYLWTNSPLVVTLYSENELPVIPFIIEIK